MFLMKSHPLQMISSIPKWIQLKKQIVKIGSLIMYHFGNNCEDNGCPIDGDHCLGVILNLISKPNQYKKSYDVYCLDSRQIELVDDDKHLEVLIEGK